MEIVRSAGRRELYDSLVFANVARMPSMAGSASSARPDDGLFEVVSRRHGRRWRIAAMALRAATIGLGAQAHVSRVVRDGQPETRRSVRCNGALREPT